MAKKKSFMESYGFKRFMGILYGVGAAIVILGALFKILHWPFANEMLIIGMGTETLIFFVSAFEPIHMDLDWTRVYPQLAEDSDDEFAFEDQQDDENAEENALKQLEDAKNRLKDINISPDLFEALSGSLEGLKDNVSQLANIESATVATNEYTSNIREASGKVAELNTNYATTVDAMSALSGSVSGAAEDAKAYHEQVQNATKSLGSLNAIYEMEIQDAQAHIKSVNQFYESLSGAMNNMISASDDVEKYKEEVAALTKNIQALNQVYGGMLSAMGRGAAVNA